MLDTFLGQTHLGRKLELDFPSSFLVKILSNKLVTAFLI